MHPVPTLEQISEKKGGEVVGSGRFGTASEQLRDMQKAGKRARRDSYYITGELGTEKDTLLHVGANEGG